MMATMSYPSHAYAPIAGSHFSTPISTKRKRAVEPDAEAESMSDRESTTSDDTPISRMSAKPSTRSFSPRSTHLSPSLKSGRAAKRRRGEGSAEYPSGMRNFGMENGFARMSLANVQERVVTQADTLVAKGEEEEEIHDVNMTSSSWFEPEKDRIVVLDLNGSDTEPDETNSTPRSHTRSRTSPFTVSRAYLDRVASHQRNISSEFPPTYSNAGAMVLYKSPPMFLQPPQVDDTGYDADLGLSPELYATIEEVDEDADVEMMDLDESP